MSESEDTKTEVNHDDYAWRLYGLVGPDDVAIYSEWLDEAGAMALRDRLDDALGPDIRRMILQKREKPGERL